MSFHRENGMTASLTDDMRAGILSFLQASQKEIMVAFRLPRKIAGVRARQIARLQVCKPVRMQD